VADRQQVLVVTDSTSDLPQHIVDDLGIVVVPLNIAFGSESFRDGIDLTPTAFLSKLRGSPVLPTTSQPPVTAFESVFREALDRDRDVVCITISADLSGTNNAARLAAESVGSDRIQIIDSRATTMQQGWVVVEAARKARAGADATEVATTANNAIPRSKLYAVLQTLDYVHKGGRIGKAQQLVGSALAIKPILSFKHGVLVPVERVRTWKKAVARITALITPTPSDIVVLHSDNIKDAQRVAADLQRSYPQAQIDISYAGATISTYAGPGALGVAALYPE
jgi:DegV family protein with EDD domain